MGILARVIIRSRYSAMPHDPHLPNAGGSAGPVIAAVRFDEAGRQCLRHALHQAAHRGTAAVALHILHETPRTLGLYRRHDDGEVLRPLVDVGRELLASFTAEVLSEQPQAAEVPLRQLVVAGVPEQRIPEVAEMLGAALVVVGPRRKAAIGRLWRRDVSGAVSKRSPCSVLAVDEAGGQLVSQRPRLAEPDRPLPTAAESL